MTAGTYIQNFSACLLSELYIFWGIHRSEAPNILLGFLSTCYLKNENEGWKRSTCLKICVSLTDRSTGNHRWIMVYTSAGKSMAGLPKMASGKISLPLGTHCCLKIFYFLYPTSVSTCYIAKNMCLYACSWLRSDCLWITVATK